MEKNWLYVDVQSMLSSVDKYADFQERYILQFKMLIEFLVKEGLLNGNSSEWLSKDCTKLRVFASDLTEEGQQLFGPPINAYFKWLSANDRVGKPISMRSLERPLSEMRGRSKPN